MNERLLLKSGCFAKFNSRAPFLKKFESKWEEIEKSTNESIFVSSFKRRQCKDKLPRSRPIAEFRFVHPRE